MGGFTCLLVQFFFVKAPNKKGNAFLYLSISEAQLKEEMFVEPQIRKLFKYENFNTSDKRNMVWTTFKNVCSTS